MMEPIAHTCLQCNDYITLLLSTYSNSELELGKVKAEANFLRLRLRRQKMDFQYRQMEYEERIAQLEKEVIRLRSYECAAEKSIQSEIDKLEVERTLANLKWGFQKREEGLVAKVQCQNKSLVAAYRQQKLCVQTLKNVCEVLCEELDTLEQPTSVRVVSEALESDQSNRIESDSNQFRQSEQFVPDESYASDNQS